MSIRPELEPQRTTSAADFGHHRSDVDTSDWSSGGSSRMGVSSLRRSVCRSISGPTTAPILACRNLEKLMNGEFDRRRPANEAQEDTCSPVIKSRRQSLRTARCSRRTSDGSMSAFPPHRVRGKSFSGESVCSSRSAGTKASLIDHEESWEIFQVDALEAL